MHISRDVMVKNDLLHPDNAKKNFILQFIYQFIVLIIPLIVSPYLTRVLGSTSLGIYTYTYSIAYYFVMFAMLGINKYGQRVIAQRRCDYILLRKTFWSLYFVHFISAIVSLILYVFYVTFICKSNQNIAYIQSLYVFSAVLDITWLFYGMEKFKIVCIRNAVIKIFETICIFCFVKSQSDVASYTWIMCLSICLGFLVMVPQVISAIPPIRFTKEEMLEHIKPLFTLFAAVIAITLYTMFDKTLLGILSNHDNVAFYEYSDKIIKIPKTFITIISTVLFPKACKFATEKNYVGMKKNMEYSLIVTYFIGSASVFGLLAVADLFAKLYYGEAFSICGKVIISMSPLILIIGLGETVRSSYIYPLKKDSTMVKILMANAAINLFISFLLIPVFGIYGAVLGTTVAELTGLIAEIWISRKYFSLKFFFSIGLPFALIGLLMFIGVKIVACFIDGSILALLVQIATGAIIYFMLTFLYGFFFNDMMKDLFVSAVEGLKRKVKKN